MARGEHEVIAGGTAARERERYVEQARDATERAYALLRDGAAATDALARALPESADAFYRAPHGTRARGVADRLAEALRPPDDDADAFARGVRMGFAAGCLVQWRMLEYLVGDEMPLWPIEGAGSGPEVD